MTKLDVIDEVIEILIKKAIEDEQEEKEHTVRGEKEDGIYAPTCYRE